MAILITGGAGYIGSHTILVLLKNFYDVVVVDNLSNSSYESLKRVEKLTNKKIKFYEGDILDNELLDVIFSSNIIDVVIHFAALKSVGESNQKPFEYYNNNVSGSLNLIKKMRIYGVRNLIFSSSATVYGSDGTVPHVEDDFIGSTTNPYGTSKYIMELVLKDIALRQDDLAVVSLRYFNPTGAHCSGEIGEDPNGTPNNLIPYIAQVAQGKIERLKIFGDDYPTKDGTGIRDYIHVMDLAEGHLKSVQYILKENIKYETFNLGTGQGYSVLEVIDAFEKISRCKIPFEMVSRRQGDVSESWANPNRANKILNWVAKRDIQDMLQDVWRWQTKNPNGYKNK